MSLPRLDESLSDDEVDRMMANATRATEFLKALAHEGRLMILCHLASGERSVTELEQLLAQRQAAVSQQLSRLRLEGLVKGRRQGKTIYYRLADERTRAMLEVVYDLFCKDDSADLPKAD
ncbi:MAG: metalloregulator ArsR/SmtB family transcription factor [Pseudomonadota bacterium]